MIHPTAIIHPKAQVDPTVEVGAYSIIDEHVVVGPHCWVGPQVYLTGKTVIGARNKFFSGAVIGEAPQDLKYKGELTGLRIGDANSFREHVTVNRATTPEEDTVIGSNCLLMGHCHIAHNCQLGSSLIIANGVLLAGHVVVADRALLSGNCLVHQFVQIGTMAMMQGGSAISQDLPPFTVARGNNGICGLNIIGLRRAGFTSEQRIELKRAYHLLFRSGQKLKLSIEQARVQFTTEGVRTLLEFVAASKRGVCRDTGALVAQAEDAEPEAE
jgi:UDP-N-acetylglucosamine acyltransferase